MSSILNVNFLTKVLDALNLKDLKNVVKDYGLRAVGASICAIAVVYLGFDFYYLNVTIFSKHLKFCY